MIPLSVVIITFNEERNIARCLDSVKEVADEIIVLDSFSTDRTKELCLARGARFEQHVFDGYTQQKNRASNMASHPTILSLDADEALSPDLSNDIKKAKQNLIADGYVMNRLTNYCGTWIHHSGWYPDRKLRLYDKRKGHWTGQYVHEKLEMNAGSKTGFLNGDLLHYSYYSIEQHKKQALQFSALAARALFEKGKKANVLQLIYKPVSRFLKAYLFQLGFLDGGAGFTIARISAWASYMRYRQLYKMWVSENK